MNIKALVVCGLLTLTSSVFAQSFKRALGVQVIPYVVVIDGEGKIIGRHQGYTDGEEEQLIEEVRGAVNK